MAAGTPVSAQGLLERLSSSVDATKARGVAVEKRLYYDVRTLDDSDEKRAQLSGALLETHQGGLLAVPHERPIIKGRVRVHSGGLVSGCSLSSSESLLLPSPLHG